MIAEDSRVVAMVLALGLLDPDCVTMEVRGFAALAKVSRLFWPDELPSSTRLERNIALVVRGYEKDGTAGIAARIAGDAVY